MADALDPKGLIREAYRIEGITPGECRSIFLDWALSVDGEGDNRARLERLLERHGDAGPDHPMTSVLREGLQSSQTPKRRGGARARER
ncbi:hypothetical protein [Roseovarius atlanticus]|uniref:hypothetical protein n=1 Tax=Roseovarius atlanticus TaxID=1641875 RepID=UPI001C972E01|nr:hypothetical protein [Roseovarius atlanticus]MBY5988902.1 hypothetical protein [Roseovarius atlanticus]MBY6124293.1 hypothetical protein [Roseovarius atlanticus]MBY6148788.1 hypothetical protein [Roseovarius atlanticus]